MDRAPILGNLAPPITYDFLLDAFPKKLYATIAQISMEQPQIPRADFAKGRMPGRSTIMANVSIRFVIGFAFECFY